MSEDLKGEPTEDMRRLIVSLEEKNDRLAKALHQARGELVKAQAQLLEVNRPPLTLGIFLNADIASRQVEAVVNGRHMRLAVSPSLDLHSLAYGQRILVAVAPDRFQRTGSIVSVLELVGDDRVLVSGEGGQEHMLFLAGPVRHGNLRPGDSLVVDLRSGIALERIIRSDVEQLLTPEIPDTNYEDIGGLDEQIAQVRDSIELPFTS